MDRKSFSKHSKISSSPLYYVATRILRQKFKIRIPNVSLSWNPITRFATIMDHLNTRRVIQLQKHKEIISQLIKSIANPTISILRVVRLQAPTILPEWDICDTFRHPTEENNFPPHNKQGKLPNGVRPRNFERESL